MTAGNQILHLNGLLVMLITSSLAKPIVLKSKLYHPFIILQPQLEFREMSKSQKSDWKLISEVLWSGQSTYFYTSSRVIKKVLNKVFENKYGLTIQHSLFEVVDSNAIADKYFELISFLGLSLRRS